MKATLETFPQGGTYYLTAASVPAIEVDGELREYRISRMAPQAVLSPADATPVSRFEFLAHLAARDESSLYMLGDVAIAVHGFAGGQGWAFERDPSDAPGRGNVRIAMRSELDAEGTELVTKVDRAIFADLVCCRPREEPGD